jgi:hypothetical protein
MKPQKTRWTLWTAWGMAAAVVLLFGSLPAGAQSKKLQVIQDKADVRLDAGERGTVIETLPRGSILTLASLVKTKINWYYVYFTSLQSGNTRAGYIHDSCVRKLFPSLKVIHISSEDEILSPTEIDLNSFYTPPLQWGTSREEIIRTEGRPQDLDVSEGREVLVYRREIMKKKCQLEYILDERRLVQARLRLLENYADKNRYIEDYRKICGFLTAKVGTPRAERVIWQDHSYESQNDCWGIALSQGHVEFRSEWVFADTEVCLTLAGGNDRVVFDADIYDVKTKKPASL